MMWMSRAEKQRSKQESAYAEAVGENRLAKQKVLALTLWGCCGEPKNGPHHEGCHLHVADPLPEIHPDQETLL